MHWAPGYAGAASIASADVKLTRSTIGANSLSHVSPCIACAVKAMIGIARVSGEDLRFLEALARKPSRENVAIAARHRLKAEPTEEIV
jgi:hypothetical protein